MGGRRSKSAGDPGSRLGGSGRVGGLAAVAFFDSGLEIVRGGNGVEFKDFGIVGGALVDEGFDVGDDSAFGLEIVGEWR